VWVYELGLPLAGVAVLMVYFHIQSVRGLREQRELYGRLRADGTRIEATVVKLGYDYDDCTVVLTVRFVSPSGAAVEELLWWDAGEATPVVGDVAIVLVDGETDEWQLEAIVANFLGPAGGDASDGRN